MSYVNLKVVCNLSPAQRDVRLPSTALLPELKARCEMLTGVLAPGMQLQLKNPENTELVAQLTDDTKSLSDHGAQDGMCLLVIDPTGGQASVSTESGDDTVEKFEISDEAYNARTDSVRAFKQRHGLGRFDPESAEARERQEREFLEEAAELAKSLAPSQRCEVRTPANPVRRGTVKFVGETKFKPGIWVGVQYDEPLGKNDGSVHGHRYFECPDKYGGFCRPQDLTVGDFPEILDQEMDEF